MPMLISQVLLWTLVIVHSILIVYLIGLLGRLHSSSPAGSQALAGRALPAVSFSDLRQNLGVDSSVFRGYRTALLFISPDCRSCRVLLSELTSRWTEGADRLAVVCVGPSRNCTSLTQDVPKHVMLLQADNDEIAETLGFLQFPMSVVMGHALLVDAVFSPGSANDVLDHVRKRPRRASNDGSSTAGELAALTESRSS